MEDRLDVFVHAYLGMSCASQKSRLEPKSHVPMSEYTDFIRHMSKIY